MIGSCSVTSARLAARHQQSNTRAGSGRIRAPAARLRVCAAVSTGADTAKALETLRVAARTKSVAPDDVVAAISVLEASPRVPTKAQISGSWDLIFSSASKIKQLQYIPIDEKLIQNFEGPRGESNIMLLGSMAPLLVNEITGMAEHRDGGVVAFQWKQLELQILFGLFNVKRPLTSGPKTYSYFYADDEIACARSSIGGMSLLRRTARE